jgi:hypothetical protein
MGLQDQIDQRVATAIDMGVREKVEQVAKRFGKHTMPSYSDSGENFHEHNWELKRGKLRINCHISYFGHCTLMVYWGEKNVFEACSNSVEHERKVRAYVPGKDWEAALDVLNKPFRVEEREQQRELKKKFGLK